MNWIEFGYWGLFLVCFLAATLIPIASEAVLLGMLALGYHPINCLLVATAGNTLGSYLNYGIGYLAKPEWFEKFRIKKETVLNWEVKIKKYGSLMALFAWLPFVGDVISVALGLFRVNWVWCFLFILVGKFLRFLVVILFYFYVK